MALPDTLVRNFAWKAGSLLLAVVIWYAIHRSTKEDPLGGDTAVRRSRELELPIAVMTLAKDARTFTIHPEAVRVTVRGYAKALASLQPTSLRAYVDLVTAREANASTCKIEVHLPPNLTLVRASPDEVQVQWPAEAQRPGPAGPVLP